MSSIYTAIPLIEDGLKQPLLLAAEDESLEMRDIDLEDHHGSQEQHETLDKTTAVGCWGQKLFTSWQFFNGFCLGFVLQTLSLGSTAIIALYYGVSEQDLPESWMKTHYELSFLFFYVLSQTYRWLLLPIICISINSRLTRNQGQTSVEKYFMPQQSEREVFVGQVRFHVGLVFGCFAVWSLIDLYFGASLHVFAALISSFLACLGFCYVMTFIYDRFLSNEEQK